jgi:hypothetical protein
LHGWIGSSWTDAALLGSLGNHRRHGALLFVAQAMTYAQANIVSPFGYGQLVASVIVGYVASGCLARRLHLARRRHHRLCRRRHRLERDTPRVSGEFRSAPVQIGG